ncbi:hypothetical protein [Flavobacterium sp. 14A]|uniref:hypothetical protein n=1 Tax=Flavobacterium sp. 14A TaxID=2735896 RepID=UPI00156E7674|nr:hypothetical protein [Flavobacterium sp. 14A]NRT11725.1 hypothetical protein [Flavobacterium sp. 14A]
MFKNSKIQSLFLVLLLLSSGISQAQCAMCRAALGGESNNAQAQAVNDGIVYLMAIPYVLVGIIGYAVYRLYQKKKAN